jgi:hypothetical protein
MESKVGDIESKSVESDSDRGAGRADQWKVVEARWVHRVYDHTQTTVALCVLDASSHLDGVVRIVEGQWRAYVFEKSVGVARVSEVVNAGSEQEGHLQCVVGI